MLLVFSVVIACINIFSLQDNIIIHHVKKFYIGLIKENGKGERLISEGYLADGPSWSPNGRTLAFYKIIKKSNNKYVSKLFTIDITGNIEKELLTPYEASDPDWGPSIKY